MSTAIEVPPPIVGPGSRRPSLLRAEALRFRCRRLVRGLLALGVLGLLTVVGIASTHYAKPSAAGLAQATQARQQQLDRQRTARAQCLADPQARRLGSLPSRPAGRPTCRPTSSGRCRSTSISSRSR